MLKKTACNGKLTIAEINSILNCIAEIRHFALGKWRNMKTGEKTHPSVLEVMATMRGQQPGKGTPDKKQPGKGTPEKRQPGKGTPEFLGLHCLWPRQKLLSLKRLGHQQND